MTFLGIVACQIGTLIRCPHRARVTLGSRRALQPSRARRRRFRDPLLCSARRDAGHPRDLRNRRAATGGAAHPAFFPVIVWGADELRRRGDVTLRRVVMARRRRWPVQRRREAGSARPAGSRPTTAAVAGNAERRHCCLQWLLSPISSGGFAGSGYRRAHRQQGSACPRTQGRRSPPSCFPHSPPST